ncbi:hypothetical protein BDV38DRAFT_287318 [Aspergillus pseudotamarii]|uniref:FAD-binding PCMH-type domain-containing protein n=1 Tax=Aspergillus pseudotamarii TaxID=132259 RepID=A0A5N6SHG1_ASPPS|nr:uncharacterized protein BDV38DRAFT_287318 [Aspergillus pseudotamarii]KAE8132843.1 hypothetical protein BDV38DRAFT_287318 [Aspergillus pseudotamarii]
MRLPVGTAVAAWAVTSACQSLPYPGSDEFEEASTRWSSLESPTVSIVVVPGTGNGLVETVKFAQRQELPFLASNGAHGAVTTLGKMASGIEIYFDRPSGVHIAQDGNTVTIAVTGTCKCVSYLGTALGGGSGWPQGRHGLIADQCESIDIVPANGILITLNSNSELWRAVKGAGHKLARMCSVVLGQSQLLR